jgi:hypothetical protein
MSVMRVLAPWSWNSTRVIVGSCMPTSGIGSERRTISSGSTISMISWLLKQHFDVAGTQAALEDAYETVALAGARRDRLDEKITVMAADCEFTSLVQRLACLRGISTLTAFALAVEVGDWDRSPEPASAPTSGWCPASTEPAPELVTL